MSSVSPREIDHIQAALAARGYKSELSLPLLKGRLAAGSAISFQFGERIASGARGLPQLILKGAFQINADEAPSYGSVRLTVEKTRTIWSDRPFELALNIDLQLAIKADFSLPDELVLGSSAIQGAYAYHHLQGLVADSVQAVLGLPIDKQSSASVGPAMRIEARLFGDLAIGRSGMVKPTEAAVSRNYQWHALAACDWLQERVLPELGLVMRDLTVQKGSATSLIPLHAFTARPSAKRQPVLETAATMSEHETLQ